MAAARRELRARLRRQALSPQAARADGFWTGAVVVRAHAPAAPVTRVRFALPDILGFDAAIAADGPMPAGPALEAARRARLLAALRREIADDDLAAVALAALYRAGGVDPAAPNPTERLLAAVRAGRTAGVGSVTYASAPAGQPAAIALPVRCALFLREAGFPLAELLQASAAAAEALATERGMRPGMAPFRTLRPVVVVWLVAEAAFDDVDWPAPGLPADATAAERRARRAKTLADLLVPQGIALGTVATP